MHVRLSHIIGMLVIISGASIVGRVVKIITINKQNEKLAPTVQEEQKVEISLGKSTEHLIWFIQISDIHLSQFHDEDRINNFNDFCNSTLNAIKPSVVLASGDLTDAKTFDHIGSGQNKGEWEIYSSILKANDVVSKYVWLDLRGNHDNFNVPSLYSSNNFYQNYSIQGPQHKRSYMYSLKKGNESVAFIAVDACLLPGPKRPFNFIGVLQPREMEMLRAYEIEASRHNYTIWFGHYPTSCILAAKPGVRKLMENGLAYLCGHLHTLGGFVPNLYTLQQTGSLELELGDWKHNRLFRVAAIDHGLFSFIDVKHGTWPIILITNPKHALFFMNQKEPLHLIENSTHIRVLLWSIDNIQRALYKIDSSDWMPLIHVEGPLYVASWTPKILPIGIHTIEVTAEDSYRTNYVSQPFSLNGEQLPFNFMARIVLMSNLSIMFQFMFGCVICICIVPLCIVRCIYHGTLVTRKTKPRFKIHIASFWFRHMWILVSIDKLFYPLVLTGLYVPIGPWFVGEILDGHIGVAFAWGIFVYSSYLPGSLTYLYGFFQMLTFHLPLIVLTAIAAERRYQLCHKDKSNNYGVSLSIHFLFMAVISFQVLNSYFFYMAYGTMALLLGPLRTWSVLFGIYMWYTASTLRKHDLRPATSIWNHNVLPDQPLMSLSVGNTPEDEQLADEKIFSNTRTHASQCL